MASKHEETKGVDGRDMGQDFHPGQRRPANTTTHGSDANASGATFQRPKK